MTDADFFGFLHPFFPGHLITIIAQPGEIEFMDSVTSAKIDITGFFAVPDPNLATVDSITVIGQPSSQLLMSWTGTAFTLGQTQGLNSNTLLSTSMRGDD